MQFQRRRRWFQFPPELLEKPADLEKPATLEESATLEKSVPAVTYQKQ